MKSIAERGAGIAIVAMLALVLAPNAARAADAIATETPSATVESLHRGLIALSRVGMRLFWSVAARTTPRLRLLEAAPVGLLVALAFGLAVFAAPVNRYLDSAARSLHQPDAYVRAVLSLETRRERKETQGP